jgi:hypothetical protein
VLAPGAIAGGGNLFVKNLRTGGYTFVGGASGAEAWLALAGLQRNEKIFLAAAPDFSWIIFRAEPPLLPGVSAPAIYRWTRTGGLSLVSEFPGGTIPSLATRSGTGRRKWPVVSTDGRVVAYQFFETGPGPILRRVGDEEPKWVSVKHIPGEPEEVVTGNLEGMTPDGRYVFFASELRLTEEAPEVGNIAGLYRYDATTEELLYIGEAASVTTGKVVLGFSDDGQTVYYGTPSDTRVWHDGQAHVVTDEPVATASFYYVTRNGRYMAWMLETDEQGTPRPEDGEAHLYEEPTDKTVCVSCLPGGGRSAGQAHFMSISYINNAGPRVVTEDGEMFFDTPNRLLTSDHNGTRDVYAYKDGQYALISPGDEAYDATFIEASADGSNVFFQTNQSLVPQDTDGSLDIYDARVGGGFAAQWPPPPPGSCRGAECAEAGGSAPSGPSIATRGGNSTSGGAPGRAQIRTVTVGRGAVRIKLHVSKPGRLKVLGRLVVTKQHKLVKAGTYTVSAPLTAKAKAMRRQGRKFTLALRLELSGSWGSSLAKYSKTVGK